MAYTLWRVCMCMYKPYYGLHSYSYVYMLYGIYILCVVCNMYHNAPITAIPSNVCVYMCLYVCIMLRPFYSK